MISSRDDPSVIDPPRYRAGARVAVQASVQPLELGANGGDGDAQRKGDLLVRQTVCDQLDDLRLASSEMAHSRPSRSA